MPGVFISYRWDDASAFVDRLYQHLIQELGQDKVFRDSCSVQQGDNLEKTIPDAAFYCDVMFVVIGKEWLRILQKRWTDPDDLLQTEIAAALQRGIPIVPLFIDGAVRPKKDELPKEISELATHLGMRVKDHDSSFERIAEISRKRVADGTKLLGRVRNIMSEFIPDQNHIAPCLERGFDFLGCKEVPGYRIDFRIYVTSKQAFYLQRSTLAKWVDHNVRYPVLIVYVNPAPSARYIFGFQLLSDWLRNNPDCLVGPKSVCAFRLHKRRITRKARQELANALEKEFGAVTGRNAANGSTPNYWRMARSRQVPLDQPELFKAVGRFNRLEVPAAVLEETANLTSVSSEEDQWHLLRDCILPCYEKESDKHEEALQKLPPLTGKWIRTILSPPAEAEITREAKELRRFFGSIDELGRTENKLPRLPCFRWKEINSWRVAFQLFPIAGLSLLRRFYGVDPMARNPSPEQLVPAFLLTSPLAIADDPGVRGSAQDILKKLDHYFDQGPAIGSRDYLVRVSFYAVCAEANIPYALNRYRNYAERREFEGLELATMRHYYQSNDANSASVVMKKLDQPTLRLMNTAKHEEWRADLLKRRGLLV